MNNKRLLICLTVLSVLLFVCFSISIVVLDKTDSLNSKYSFAVGVGPYGLDIDSVDRADIHSDIEDLIDVPFSIGIAKSYSHGYPELIIITKSESEIDASGIVDRLTETHPELSVTLLETYEFGKLTNNTINYQLIIEILLAAVLFLVINIIIIKQ